MCKVNVYCDESGNSGDNYVDPEQPFFVLGAWAIPYDRLADVAASVEKCRQKYAPQATELKSRSMLRTPRNRDGLAKVVEELGKMECLPIFLISEKRFFIAAKIIETYADPANNPLLHNAFTGDSTTKIEFANAIYKHVPEAVLNRFARAYRRPAKDEFENCLDEITAAVEATVNKELAILLNGCRANLEEIAELEGSDELLGSARATLNLPTFVSMLMLIEQIAREGYIKPQRLIHDEQSAYGPVFEKIHNIHLNARESRLIYPNGAEVLLPIKNISSFGMESSKTSLFLQAADLMAGTVAYLSKAILTKREFDESEAKLADLTIPAIWLKEPRLAWPVASSVWLAEAAKRCLVQQGPPGDVNDDRDEPGARSADVDRSPLPILPVTPKVRDHLTRKPRFPSRPFGIVRRKNGQLMLLRNLQPHEASQPTAALLFSSEKAAQRVVNWFSADGDLPEPFDIVEFDGAGFAELGQKLEAALEHTELLIIDYKDPAEIVCKLESVAAGYSRMCERVVRAGASGVLGVILQAHQYRDYTINTVLAGDGSYTSVIVEFDRIFKGSTRDSALAAAKRFIDEQKGPSS